MVPARAVVAELLEHPVNVTSVPLMGEIELILMELTIFNLRPKLWFFYCIGYCIEVSGKNEGDPQIPFLEQLGFRFDPSATIVY